MLQSSSSDKKLVKPLKDYFFGPKLHKKGSLMGHTENEKQFICRHKNRLSAFQFQKLFLLSKYMFSLRLSYESFSILKRCFLSKKSLPANSCMTHKQ